MLVEEEDADVVAGAGAGAIIIGLGGRRGRRRRRRGRRRGSSESRDEGGEPRGRELDALERVSAVDMPCQVLLAADFTAAGPAHLFEPADEFGGERTGAVGCGANLTVAQGGELGLCDGDREAGVCFLEIGRETELDVVQGRVSVDHTERRWDLGGTLAEDVKGCWRLRSRQTRGAGFHDSAFMPCDFLNGVS